MRGTPAELHRDSEAFSWIAPSHSRRAVIGRDIAIKLLQIKKLFTKIYLVVCGPVFICRPYRCGLHMSLSNQLSNCRDRIIAGCNPERLRRPARFASWQHWTSYTLGVVGERHPRTSIFGLMALLLASGCATFSPPNESQKKAISPDRHMSSKPVLDVLGLGSPRLVRGSALNRLISGHRFRLLLEGVSQPSVRRSETFYSDRSWEAVEYQLSATVRRGSWNIDRGRVCTISEDGKGLCRRFWTYPLRPEVALMQSDTTVRYGYRALAYTVSAANP